MPPIVEAYQYVEPRRVRQPYDAITGTLSRRLSRSRLIHEKTSRTMCASSSTTFDAAARDRVPQPLQRRTSQVRTAV